MSLSEVESSILETIIVSSENNPFRPEFPPASPKFPATPTIKFEVPGFTNVWVKDESHNLTGTHKDRMAWEIIVTYRNFLISKKNNRIENALPQMSIISSGCAAVAIQTLLNQYRLPALKVLMDSSSPEETVGYLKSLGCEIYQTDLSKKPLQGSEILDLTENPTGLDITSDKTFQPTIRFYDWLSFEILNQDPEYCFIPFGTGNPYENVLNIIKRELSKMLRDPRFIGDIGIVKKCHFLGATTNDPKSLADKLYSPHRPFAHYNEEWIETFRVAGFCGDQSNVRFIEERYIREAMELAEINNLKAEPSGLAGLALFLQMKEKIPQDAKVIIVNTGRSMLCDIVS